MADKTTETKREQGLTLENKSEQVSKKLWFTDRVKSLLKIKSGGVVDAQNERMLNKQMKEREIFPSDYKPSDTERRLYIKTNNQIYYLDSTLINQLSVTDSMLLDSAAIEATLATLSSDVSSIESDLASKTTGLHRVYSVIAPPVASTTYYSGAVPAFSTNAAVTRIYFPVGVTVKAIHWAIVFFGTPTAGSLTINFTKNLSSDTLLTNSLDLSALTAGVVYPTNVTGLSLGFSAGDYFQFKTGTPAWGTAPTQLYLLASIYFE